VRIRISVSEEDIAQGARGSAGACPIACAMMRVFERGPMVRASVARINGIAVMVTDWPDVWHGGIALPSGTYVDAPPEAREFMERFDAGAKVEPFDLWLDIPDGEPAIPAEEVAPALAGGRDG